MVIFVYIILLFYPLQVIFTSSTFKWLLAMKCYILRILLNISLSGYRFKNYNFVCLRHLVSFQGLGNNSVWLQTLDTHWAAATLVENARSQRPRTPRYQPHTSGQLHCFNEHVVATEKFKLAMKNIILKILYNFYLI